MSRFLAVWPVLDQDRTLTQLTAEAMPQLARMLDGLTPAGPPIFTIRGDIPWPDTNIILTATITINQAASIQTLTSRGIPDTRIAQRVGVHRNTIRNHRLRGAA